MVTITLEDAPRWELNRLLFAPDGTTERDGRCQNGLSLYNFATMVSWDWVPSGWERVVLTLI